MTHDMRRMAEPFLGVSAEHVQHMRILAARADPRTATRPPWSWANLTDEETVWLDAALDHFVDTYNLTCTVIAEDVIPPCWRQHPRLIQELPVQLWIWWATHFDERSEIRSASEYYERYLPGFQGRLRRDLLGRGALKCRRGTHLSWLPPSNRGDTGRSDHD